MKSINRDENRIDKNDKVVILKTVWILSEKWVIIHAKIS